MHSGANAAGAAGPMQFGIGGAGREHLGRRPRPPRLRAHRRVRHRRRPRRHRRRLRPRRRHPLRRPRTSRPTAPPATSRPRCSPTTTPPAYVTDVLGWAARYAAGGAQAVAAASSPACQLAAAGPLPAGTAGKVIAYAEAQLGKPYQWGATGPDAFDCSGLAMMAYRAAGITIPRTSQQQWAYGRQIPASQVQPGDLVFFAGADGTITAPGHVGIVTRPRHHDRRPHVRRGCARGKLQRQHRPGGLHPPIDNHFRRAGSHF